LMHLSDISNLRRSIECKFSSIARKTSQHTRTLLDNDPSDQPPCFNLVSYVNNFSNPTTHIPRSTTSSCCFSLPKLQKPEPLRGIFEIFPECGLVMSPERYSKYPRSSDLDVADKMDLDYRSAASVFRIWRGMFTSEGSLSGFNANAKCQNGLVFNVTHHAVSGDCIPELSMIFNAISADEPLCRYRFLCCFNCYWFHPERFNLYGLIKMFTQQLVQLITAKLISEECAADMNTRTMNQGPNHPQKRPALEK
jgi:hypothetical protein